MDDLDDYSTIRTRNATVVETIVNCKYISTYILPFIDLRNNQSLKNVTEYFPFPIPIPNSLRSAIRRIAKRVQQQRNVIVPLADARAKHHLHVRIEGVHLVLGKIRTDRKVELVHGAGARVEGGTTGINIAGRN